MCCNSWGRKESDMSERLNWTEMILCEIYFYFLQFKNLCPMQNCLAAQKYGNLSLLCA